MVKISAQEDQVKMHLLHKVPFLSRSENNFLRKIHPDYGIFLHGKVRHDPKNIWEFIENLLSRKNEGCFIID